MTDRFRMVLRWLAAALFVVVGVKHFRAREMFERIVPPALPRPDVLVMVSGVAEIAGGIGLLVPPLRRPAAWGLVALLIAVFPANVYMAMATDPRAKMGFPQWALWVRLPVQAVMIAWVWWVSRPV